MDVTVIVWYFLYISSAFGELPTAHVIRGCEADIRNFPYQVSLKNISEDGHICGGVIITKKFVLTAAHCVNKRLMKHYYIYAGSSFLNSHGQKYLIDREIHYPGYTNKTKINDIAIIAIQNKFNFSVINHIMPIRIYLGYVPVGTMLTVSGFGLIQGDGHYVTTNRLQTTQLTLIDRLLCKKSMSNSYPILTKQFCTFDERQQVGACKGDSGGPVTIRGMLVGLISWGLPCVKGQPDVHTKVAAHASWITKTINKYCRQNSCPKEGTHPVYVVERKKKLKMKR